MGSWYVTLCSSALEQPTDKFDTVLESWQIGDEDPTIKNPTFSSQESGMSFMSPKGHLWKTRSICISFLATEELDTVLESCQIGDEDPTIKNPAFLSQESGMSFMSPKGHLWKTRSIFVSFLATEEFDTVLESCQIGDKDPTIKSPPFS